MKPLMKAWVITIHRHLRSVEVMRVLNIISYRTSSKFIEQYLQELSSMFFLNGEEQCDDVRSEHRFTLFSTSEHHITLDASQFLLVAQRSDILEIKGSLDTYYCVRWKGRPYVRRSGGPKFCPPEMSGRFARPQIEAVLPISVFPPEDNESDASA